MEFYTNFQQQVVSSIIGTVGIALAQKQYEKCAQVLEDELGIPPTNETRRLLEQAKNNRVSQVSQVSFSTQTESALHDTSVVLKWVPNSRCTQFIGRDLFIEKSLELLRNPHMPPILVFHGGPGYGKTELALEVAKKSISTGFEDVLWVTARTVEFHFENSQHEYDTNGFTKAKFLEELALQLKCPQEEVLPIIGKSKFLIVLDNAETADTGQILPYLVKSLTFSRTVLTSRLAPEPAPYLRSVPIPGLDRPSSRELLLHEASEDIADVVALRQATELEFERIYTLSQGAPLALHFIVSRVKYDHELAPVLEQLKQVDRQVESFYEFCLGYAWNSIGANSQALLATMKNNIAPVPRTMLEEVCLLSQSDLMNSLRELERWHLVEVVRDSRGIIKYDLHPWVRSSINSGLLREKERSPEERKRLVEWNKRQLRKGQ